MNCLDQARHRVEQATGVPAILDAAYTAFLAMLPVIEDQQDPASPWFVGFVLAGASAASARFALTDAASLPAAVTCPAPAPAPHPADETAAAIVRLAQALVDRLDDAALLARQDQDRDASAAAAWHARELCASLGGEPPS
jgi:hypothetical protein